MNDTAKKKANKMDRKIIFVLAVAAFLALAAYNFVFLYPLSPDSPTADQLAANPGYYEGKTITLLYVIAQQSTPQNKSFTVSEAAGKAQVKVNYADLPNYAASQGQILAVTGVSRLQTLGALQATKIHYYDNVWWRPAISLLGLLALAFIAWKEKPWAKQK